MRSLLSFLCLIPLLFLLQGGCVSKVVDYSMQAAEAGDRTLIVNACGAVSQAGVVCLLKENTEIESSVQFLVPFGDRISDGELTIWYMDMAPKNYPITSSVVTIDLKDFFKESKWSTSHSGELTAVARVRYEDSEGIKKEIKTLGFVRLFILKEAYAGTMPFGSGYHAWESNYNCSVQWSTSGRSAISCEPR